MEIRLAFPNEVEKIMAIIEEARNYLAQSGSDQWQTGYPSQEDIFQDVLQGRGWVGLEDGQLLAHDRQ